MDVTYWQAGQTCLTYFYFKLNNYKLGFLVHAINVLKTIFSQDYFEYLFKKKIVLYDLKID